MADTDQKRLTSEERAQKQRLLKELTTFYGNMGEPETREEYERKHARIKELQAELTED